MLLLERLPIDLVEMVIVKSDEYKLFERLQKLLPKLQEPQRLSRINDKLTKVCITDHGISYYMGMYLHREYSKPSFIKKTRSMYTNMYDFKHYSCYKVNGEIMSISISYRETQQRTNYMYLKEISSSYVKNKIKNYLD